MKTFFTCNYRSCNHLPFVLAFMALIGFYATSCSKDSSGDPSGSDDSNGSVPKSDIVGYQNNGSMKMATYWKDGVATVLSDSSKDAQAFSVSVSGSDVYIAGYQKDESGSLYDDPSKMPKLWKNGVLVPLSVFDFGVGVSKGTNGVAMSVCAKNGNAYIVGYMQDGGCNDYVAVIWKNGGTPTLLTNQYNSGSQANSVFVTESGDVYVAGTREFDGGIGNHAALWVNGNETLLTDATVIANAYSVFVSGSDVYVCGNEFNNTTSKYMAVYWKNGIINYLTDGSTFATANSISVSGKDVYVVGEKALVDGSMSDAICWKNGVATSLSKGTGSAKSIYISGTDVYVCGYKYYGATYSAACWENGSESLLTNSTKKAFANGIFIR